MRTRCLGGVGVAKLVLLGGRAGRGFAFLDGLLLGWVFGGGLLMWSIGSRLRRGFLSELYMIRDMWGIWCVGRDVLVFLGSGFVFGVVTSRLLWMWTWLLYFGR